MASLASKLLFCEGGPGSTDIIVIRAAIANPSITVRPVGSKRALMAFVEDPMIPADCACMAIRDRDFDFLPVGTPPSLLRTHPTLPIYAWQRLEIENYLLDGPVLKPAYDALRASQAASLPEACEAELTAYLGDAAREIGSYQAARWTLGQLRPSVGWPYLRRDWCDAFRLPADRSREGCWESVIEEVGLFAGRSREVSEARAERLFDDFHTQFGDPEFVSRQQHTTWFSGKDLLASLMERLNLPVGAAKIMARHGRDALVKIGPSNSHPDFAELAHLAAQL
jgi:hypothetical protein